MKIKLEFTEELPRADVARNLHTVAERVVEGWTIGTLTNTDGEPCGQWSVMHSGKTVTLISYTVKA